jgi:hypothetical protein
MLLLSCAHLVKWDFSERRSAREPVTL